MALIGFKWAQKDFKMVLELFDLLNNNGLDYKAGPYYNFWIYIELRVPYNY